MFPFLAALVLTLPGTRPLAETGALWEKMLTGIEHYLDRALASNQPVPAKPEIIKTLIGAVDPRIEFTEIDSKPYAANAQTARWPVLKGMDAEGLLITSRQQPTSYVIAIPDAGISPERFKRNFSMSRGMPS